MNVLGVLDKSQFSQMVVREWETESGYRCGIFYEGGQRNEGQELEMIYGQIKLYYFLKIGNITA